MNFPAHGEVPQNTGPGFANQARAQPGQGPMQDSVDRPLIKNRAFLRIFLSRPAQGRLRTKVKKAGAAKERQNARGEKDLVLGQLSTLFDD